MDKFVLNPGVGLFSNGVQTCIYLGAERNQTCGCSLGFLSGVVGCWRTHINDSACQITSYQ